MTICKHCGQQIEEGEVHACQEVAAASEMPMVRGNNGLQELSNAVKQVDRQILVGLLRNPLSGLQLSPSKELMYGIVGIASSLIGFLVWAFLVQKKMESLLDDLFGGFSLFSMAEGPSLSNITGKLFLISLISMAVLLVSLWLLGNQLGSQKQSFIEVITRLGATQLISGPGFVISGIFVFIYFQFSLVLLVVTLLFSLLVTVVGAHDLFKIAEERRASFLALAVAVYMIVVAVITKTVI